ncbi:UPF0389 protein CG9231 [Uranotaenia lowii]|uniref:UPF0389 protein CG9231 n=1 Tax=Uranotaenia lowii TaxID=190385 RepID=UPI002478F34E|nr:UPF0389 protein CG9231 [Uranotaenia lowii]
MSAFIRTVAAACVRSRITATQKVARRPYSSSGSVEPTKGAPSSGNKPPPTTSAESAHINPGARSHMPNNLEKRMLVFTKKYKSIDEVPRFINQEVMERCRNQVRIKIANYMMVATALGCILMIISGKRALERGESVQKMNLDWHKEYNERARAEEASAKK